MMVENRSIDVDFTNEKQHEVRVKEGEKLIAKEWFPKKFWTKPREWKRFTSFVLVYKELDLKEFENLKIKLDAEYQDKIQQIKSSQGKEIIYDYESEAIDIKELIQEIEKEFPHMWQPTEVCLSIIHTILLEDLSDPMSINLVGSPSSEKTTILGFFYGLDEIIFRTDSFSPKSFVSHANLPKEQLEGVDLLPKIKNKCIVIPELAPIFGKRKEDLIENLSVITRVFDGEGYESDSGVHGHRGYHGEYLFSWLGATTPLSNHVWQTMGKLGNRFMFYDIPPKNKNIEELKSIMQNNDSYKIKREKCKNLIHNFVKTSFSKYKKPLQLKWNKSSDDSQAIELIALLAKLLVRLRATVDIFEVKDNEGNNHYSYSVPLIEEPERAITMLYNIARGRALIYSREHINLEDIPLIFKVVISSCPYERSKVIQIYFKRKTKFLNTSQISTDLNCSIQHAKRIMKQFEILGIIKQEELRIESGNIGRPENRYTLVNNLQNLLTQTIEILEKYDFDKYSVWCRNDVQNEAKVDSEPKNTDFEPKNDITQSDVSIDSNIKSPPHTVSEIQIEDVKNEPE